MGCKENLGYYKIKGENNDMCFSKDTIEEGYFLSKSEIPYQWDKCYEKCATCNYKGNNEKMACLTCKTNYTDQEFNKSVNLKLSKGNCKIVCPTNKFLTYALDCVESCTNGTYEYVPNRTCLNSCPENFEINTENTGCIFSSFKNNNTSVDDFKEIIFSNISSFTNNSTTVIEFSDFKALVIPAINIDPIEQVKMEFLE
jgi:hypothetical protein